MTNKTQAAPDGWCFMSADFSIQASGVDATGQVMLVRAPADKARWHAMPESCRADVFGPPLYIHGSGPTFTDAMADATLKALTAAPIVDAEHAEGELK